MHYYLYKLKFTTPVHFGADVAGIGVEKCSPTCHADTFFSALCQEILYLHGEKELNRWANLVDENKFLLSDLFPYYGEYLYLPKPVMPRKKVEIEDETSELDARQNKKLMKKLKFIPVKYWEQFIEYINAERDTFDPREDESFYKEVIYPKVSITRTEEKNDLYSVGAYVYQNKIIDENNSNNNKEQAGLYFVIYIDDVNKEAFDKILKSLQFSGIGGERSSGFGKFEIHKVFKLGTGSKCDMEETLYSLIINADSKKYKMSLSVISPDSKDLNHLEEAYYTLIPRKGFIASSTYSDTPVKRQPVVMFNTGSCFTKRLNGNLLDLRSEEDRKINNHKVYRYGKAIMVGI
ncbi:MAG: type III-A CRISPR-associated RAMP protein Csm4 [Cyanobacteriota bacterium]